MEVIQDVQEVQAPAQPHEYARLLTANEPMAPQPQGIRVELKAHQKAAIAKAVLMEKGDGVSYNIQDPQPVYFHGRESRFKGHFTATGNVGILGDLVGHGKTLTALGIIASNPVHQIQTDADHVYSYVPPLREARVGQASYRVVCKQTDAEVAQQIANDHTFETTLILVPRGPVFLQWKNALEKQTRLKACVIDNIKCIRSKMPPSAASDSDVREWFESHDCIVMKTTTFKVLCDHYRFRERPNNVAPIPGFSRIIIDEAHDEITAVPMMQYKFMWLISSTYDMIGYRAYNSVNYISYSVRHLMDMELLRLMVIRGNDDFVRASFELPRMSEYTYICKMNRMVAALHAFLAPAVQERLNVNDIAGAVREMGGKAETEEELVRVVTAGMTRDINNKTRELAYARGLEIDVDVRNAMIHRLEADLHRLEERKRALEERITALDEKQCAICMEPYEEPVMLNCTHVFCGQCVVDWMRVRGGAAACPTCRVKIEPQKMVAVVAERPPAPIAEVVQEDVIDIGTNEGDRAMAGRWSKEEQLIRLIRRKPNGKWLVFTRVDSGFNSLREALVTEGITFAELKGNTNVMMNTLENFKSGALKVILLHTYHAGSGIDISCATDVCLLHALGMERIQAIGRAQRVGRTTPLTVHQLLYPAEA